MSDNSNPQAFSRMDSSFLGAWWWTIDRTMLGCIIVLLIFGVAIVATASPSVAQRIGASDYYFIIKHIIFFFPTIMLIIGISMFSPRYVWRLSSLMFLGAIVMMVLVLFVGVEEKGARRWIKLFGFSLQPSEFIKPAFAVVVAWFIALQKKKEQINDTIINKDEKSRKGIPIYYAVVAVSYIAVMALLIMQPDLGMSIVVTLILSVQVFLAGMRFRYLAGVLAFFASALTLAYFSLYHVRSRIDRFFDPSSGDNYQVERSLATIRNGGIIGVGPGQGVEKNTLPDAHADFTFSVLVEEGGAVLGFIIISLFLFILLRGFKRLQESHDTFSIIAAGGLFSMLAIQSLVHIGSSINLLPAKGMTLPFISYGGSSMVSMGIAMGMVLALTRYKGRLSSSHSKFKSGRP